MITRNKKRRTKVPGKWKRRIRWSVLFYTWMVLILTGIGFGQDIENHGSLTNRGLFRLKGTAVNLPDTIGGSFDYKGSDQIVPARTYRNLLLTGSGFKNSTPGNLIVKTLVSIDSSVILSIDSTSVLKLQGKLNENGYLSGKIENTTVLGGSSANSDFGGIGASISWTGVGPDTTTVTRTSGHSLTGNNNQSIQRYYNIIPRINSGLDATLVFHYSKNELNGRDPSKLVLWSSTDYGAQWKAQGGLIDTAHQSITKTGITNFGLWTASDSIHPLGAYRNATFLALSSGNKQVGAIKSTLSPFIVTVTSQDSVPMAGVHVSFAITAMPALAVGASLNIADAITDNNGQVKCVLTLGDKIGNYSVTAAAAGLLGSPQVFNATATSGPPAIFAMQSGNNQSQRVLSTLQTPFIISVRDTGNNPVPNAPVTFKIEQMPNSSSGAYLSGSIISTDSNGMASVNMTLGNKKGIYIVSASTGNLTSLKFSANAVPASPAVFALNAGDNQHAKINTSLPVPFVAVINDSFGNGIENLAVQFSISGTPSQAAGQMLSVSSAHTDSNGLVSTDLKLGDKIGLYTVTATSAQFGGKIIVFTAHASVGAAAVMALSSGSSQSGEILTALPVPFSVTLTDSGGNLIPGDTVQFKVLSAPTGANEQWLSVSSGITDSIGTATSQLTLGDREGSYTVAISTPSLPGHQVLVDAYATVLMADANNDHSVNIGDLTTMIDAINKKTVLSQANFIRADLNADAVVDWKDADSLLTRLLKGTYDKAGSLMGSVAQNVAVGNISNGKSSTYGTADSLTTSGEFEVTPHGLRFNLNNVIPVRGIQIILKAHIGVNLNGLEIFNRGKIMLMPVNVTGNVIRIVAYNANNTEITPGAGSLFRLPLSITDLSQFDVVSVVISDQNNHGIVIPASKITGIPGEYPESFVLEQNYPNPFNPETKIDYTVPDKTGKFVSILLQVFDLSGRKVKTLEKGDHEAGHYSAIWNGTNDQGNVVASGVYLVRLWWPNNMIVKKMLLTK
ncbi:MAG: FlgD immunoglobulin-like domain containing protein [Bacteroidota bacterium]